MKVRIKGTNIYVRCHGIQSDAYGHSGIYCTYLNGEHEGASEVISRSCLVEEEE